MTTIGILVVTILLSSTVTTIAFSTGQKEVTLKAIVAEPGDRWKILFGTAIEKLRERHPEMNIHVNYTVLPTDGVFRQILSSPANNLTNVDLYSVDQIWLGNLAEYGLLQNLTQYTNSWNRSSEWNDINWKGGSYKDDVYGIWAWTDVRAMWYWKDLLNRSGVEPDSLKTWNGYLNTTKKLEAALPNNIRAMHLVAAQHSPDMWYPYLWMLGGDILVKKQGHPVKGEYWFPAYNSTAGVKALTFIKDQIQAGIRPQIKHFWGQEFADKKYAVMLEGSWLPGAFKGNPLASTKTVREQVGMIPMFPVPDGINKSATMMGGWLLAMSSNSTNKDLTWELIATMVEPDVLLPMFKQTGYLPTQKAMMNGTYLKALDESIPYYRELTSMIPVGHIRPNIPEYPQIADDIRIALEQVYMGINEPKEALDESANATAKLLGW